MVAFKDNSEPTKEVELNLGMMRRVVRTIAKLSSNLQFFVYPGGTRVRILFHLYVLWKSC